MVKDRQRYLDRQAQYDLMIDLELKKRRAPTVGTPNRFTQQDAKRLAWYFRTDEIPEENRSDISVFERLIEEVGLYLFEYQTNVELNRNQNKWEWCARHSDIEWQLLYSVKREPIDALAASDEPLDYAMPTPIKGETGAPMSSSKRARPSEVTPLDGGPIAKRRRFNEASTSVSKIPNTLAAPIEGNDPTLVSPLARFQANGDTPIVGRPRSGAEPVVEAEVQITGEVNMPEERGTRLADGETADISVAPESTRSLSIQLVSSSKPPKRKWRSKAFNPIQSVVDDDYFETPAEPPHPHGPVVDPTLEPLNQRKADAAGQRKARQETAEVVSLDLEFEEVGLGGTVAEMLEHNVNTTGYPEELTARNEPQTFSSPAEGTSTTAINGIPFNIPDEYQHPMPQYPAVPDIFLDPPVEGSTITAIGPWLVAPLTSQKGSQSIEDSLTSGHLDQRDSPTTRDTLSFEQASGTLHAVDGYSQSSLPSSSASHSSISSIPTHAPTNVDASLRLKAAKRNGERNHFRSSPITSGRPPTNTRAPPQGVPIPVRDSSPIRRSSPPQLRKESRRRTFGGWPTNPASSSLRKGETKISNTRRKWRDSTTALPAAMIYRDQQEDADWLRSVEKKTRIIPRYADPRKRSIPSLPPEPSSDDTNTASGSGDEDEDDLAKKVSRMSSLDIERVMNALNVAPRNKVLKQWRRQNRSDAWITWNGLDFVLEELAGRFSTRVTAAREAWAASGDLVVTEKALHHAQDMSRRIVADVIKSEAEVASKRRMQSWAPSRRTSEQWARTKRRTTGLYPRSGGPPDFVPAEAVQVAVEAASSPRDDHEVRRGPSRVLSETLELPMLSFDGVGPGRVSILRE
jgi:hypothetical protein